MGQLTKHISELDHFLAEFDEKHPEQSASQQKEAEKYAKIDRLRDSTDTTTVKQDKSNDFWSGF